MILKKQFRLSAATNKQFAMGEMINFVQVDAQKLVWMSRQLAMVASIPFLLVFSAIALFYYIGWSCIAVVFMLGVTICVNLWIGKRGERIQAVQMKHSDARVKATSESLNNIRMLKLYSWSEIFNRSILSKREEELKWLWKRF